MSDWRETASPQAQEDLDGLLSFALEHATRLIKDRGRLVPFAVTVPAENAFAADAGERAGSRAVLAALYAAARQHAATHRAVAFAADITFEGGRAIRIEAEHREGVTLALRVPYRRTFLGGVKLGTMRLSDGPSRIWP